MRATQARLPYWINGWRDVGLGLAGLGAGLVLALLPLSLALPLLALPLLAVLVLLEPLWGLYALVLSVPVQEQVLLPFNLTITQLLAGLALISWLLRMLQQRRLALPAPLLRPWFGFLLLLILAGAFADYSVDQSIKELGRWLAALLAFALAVASISSPRRAWGLIACLLLAALAEALLGLWQFFTASGPPSFLVGRFARAHGTFGKPNPLAGYLNMAWPLALALAAGLLAAARRSGKHRAGSRTVLPLAVAGLCGCAVAALLLAGLGATYSRGGWVGAAAGLLAMAMLLGRRAGLVGGLSVATLLLFLVLGGSALLPAGLGTRVQSIVENLRIFDAATANVNDENFAIVERMAHWQAGWRMWLSHPVTGVGPGNYYLAYNDYFVGRWYISQGHAHNYYIHIAAEAGLPGLLAYLVLIGSVASSGWRALRTRNRLWRMVAVGGCGIIVSVAAHNLFENLHVLNMGIQLSSVWALLVWLAEAPQLSREDGA